MPTYELTVVLPGDATKARKKNTREDLGKIINTLKGEIEDENDWGEIDLAFQIKGNESGNFLNFLLKLKEDKADSLNEKLKVEEGVIRYLLIKKGKE